MKSVSSENQNVVLPEVFYNHTAADTVYVVVVDTLQHTKRDKQMFEYQYVGLTFVLLLVLMLLWGLRRQVNG